MKFLKKVIRENIFMINKITITEAKKRLSELMEVLNAGPISDDNNDLWGEVYYLNELIDMHEREQFKKNLKRWYKK